MTGVGLIGTRGIGRSHRRAWRVLGSSERYAEVRLVREAGSADNWRELVADPDVDIVDICTPDALHGEMVVAALEAGKHVICEKPLWFGARTEQIVALATDGPTVTVCFVYRHLPAVAYTRRLVADGVLGRVTEFRVSYLQQWALTQGPSGWRHDVAGSGVVGDLGTHALDLSAYLLPGFQEAEVRGADSADLQMRASWLTRHDGVSGVFTASRTTRGHDNDLSLDISGELGSARFSSERPHEVVITSAEGNGLEQLVRVDEMTNRAFLESWWAPGADLGWGDPWVHQLADAVDRARGLPVESADLAAGVAADSLAARIRECA